MRLQIILLAGLLFPVTALAQDGSDAPDDTEKAVEGDVSSDGDPATEEDSEGEVESPVVVINGNANLLINGDIYLESADGTGTVTVEGGPAKETAVAEPVIAGPIKILKIFPGEVKIDVGAADGVNAGERFAVFRKQVVETEAGEDEKFQGEELVAVIEVIAVAEKSSIAEVWKGDRIRLDDQVRPALSDHESSQVYPRKLPGVGEIALVLRPLLAVGSTGGFGGLADVTAAYWWKYMFLDIRMQPLGFGWTEDGNIVSASFMAAGGYDGRAFAIGLGVGVSTVNGDLDEMMQSFGGVAEVSGDSTDPQVTTNQSTKAAFTLSQQVRLGARDGLNMTVYNLLMYNKGEDGGEDDTGFIYAGTSGKITIPLAARTFLFVEGGGGVMGYAFGDLGVFTWVRGSGDGGSIGICALAGGAAVWGVREKTTTPAQGQPYTETEQVLIAGPMIGLGMTYRFGF